MKVGISTYTPMEDNNEQRQYSDAGTAGSAQEALRSYRANAEYFDSVGTRVVMGRGIGVQDTSTAPAVAVVNQAFVKTFFKPGENPIGAHFGFTRSFAGRFRDCRRGGGHAYTDVRWKDHPMYFLPLMQRPRATRTRSRRTESLYAGAIVLETARPMNDMEATGAEDAREHQSEPVGGEVPDLR